MLDRCFEFVDRMIEAFTDPKTWLFALFAAVNNLTTSLSIQLQIIVVSFGFNPLQTTLLSSGMGALLIVSIFTGVKIAARIPNSIAWVGIACFVPGLLGVFLVNFLPWHDKVGLLASIWVISTHRIRYSAKTPIPLILVISSLRHWLCFSFVLGVANYGWAYEESHNECDDSIWVLHWQCYWAVHVESKI